MKYSKATNYALHTMLFLAASDSDKPVGVQQLSKWQNVSPTYLSKILTKLTKEGMIHSSSGAHGGYTLQEKWEDLTFLDIIQAIEGTTSLFDCCHHKQGCLIQETMITAEGQMEEVLKNRKLSSIAGKISMMH
ncbi:transcriptional regulator [Paenibacillus amylolyticus]|uniref:Rrf2 family transcriptional regulator n=1 Tax=Paenibacillus amylolyticus TaxID=1451 RepID=UPI00096C51F8|nr:Rrf2 family transcriptional regulator [Paenibacillus amylolyticus]OME94491.1 transcriptional regulator [Paenibacillus amylolyticus]